MTVFSEQTTTVDDKPTAPKMNARDKAAATDEAARQIIGAEADARESKTEKLRALRLQRQAAETKAPEKKPATRRRSTAKS